MPDSEHKEIQGILYASGEPTKWDPLVHLIYKCRWTKNGYGPVVWGLILDVVFNLFRLGAAALDGFTFTKTISSNKEVLGFFNDPSVLTNFFFGWLIFSFHVWLHKGLGQVFDELVGSGVFSADPVTGLQENNQKLRNVEEINSHLRMAFKSQNSWWRMFFMAASFILVISVVGKQYMSMEGRAWYTAGVFSRSTAMVWAGLLVASLTGLLFGFFHLIRHLRKMFASLDPVILPAHPDGVGGLSPLGQFALRLVYLISLVGVMLLAITPYTRGMAINGALGYSLSPGLIFAACFYAVVSPVVFFMVLGTASKAMETKKNEALKASCRRLNLEYMRVSSIVDQSPNDELKGAVEELESAQKFNSTIRSFPVWPFDSSSTMKFTTSYFAPVIVGVFVQIILMLLGLTK